MKFIKRAFGEHSTILSTFIKLPFSNKTFILYIFEWPLKTGFTVYAFIKTYFKQGRYRVDYDLSSIETVITWTPLC